MLAERLFTSLFHKADVTRVKKSSWETSETIIVSRSFSHQTACAWVLIKRCYDLQYMKQKRLLIVILGPISADFPALMESRYTIHCKIREHISFTLKSLL